MQQRCYFWELFYLGIKWATKSLNSLMPPKVKVEAFNWAELALKLLEQDFQMEDWWAQEWASLQKGSPEFYQFHAYKWTLKYLQKFTLKMLFHSDYPLLRTKFDFFMAYRFEDMVKILTVRLRCDQFEKLRFHEVKLLEAMVSMKPLFFLRRA